MNFKCKCGSNKYRQISTMVKQCLECGMTIQDEGFVDTDNLDFSEEPDPLEEKQNEELEKLWSKIKTTSHFYNGIFGQFTPLVYTTVADSGTYNGSITGTSTGSLTTNNAYSVFDNMF